MKKINLPLILIHLIATIFIIFSFQKFVGIFYFELFELVIQHGLTNFLENSQKYGYLTSDMGYFSMVINMSSLFAILISFIISIWISLKENYSIVNSIILMFLAFLLDRFNMLNWITLKHFPSYLIDNIFYSSIIGSVIFLCIGLFIFIFITKRLNNIIKKYNC